MLIWHGELQINQSQLWSPLFSHSFMFWSSFLRWTDNTEEYKMPAQQGNPLPSRRDHIQHHHIKSLCWNVTDVTGDDLQCQLQGGGQSIGTISTHNICMCAHPFMAQRMLALAMSRYMTFISSLLDSMLWTLSKHVDKCVKLLCLLELGINDCLL